MSSGGIAASPLTSLPSEILKRIVELGPCESALSLRRVCHILRDICDDPLVYAAIIENGNGFDAIPTLTNSEGSGSASASARSLKWWRNVRRHGADDGAAASRWALADSRILCWLQDLCITTVDTKPITEAGNSDTENLRTLLEPKLWKALKWLPELILAGHPGAAMVLAPSQSELGTLLQLAETSEDASLQWRASFLCGADDKPAWPSTITMRLGMGFNAVFPPDFEEKDSGSWSYPFSPAHQVYALISIRHFRRRLNIAFESRSLSPLDLPPPTHRMSFSSYIQLTAPFPPRSDIVSPNLDTMLSSSFLEDGEWVGYYNYGRALNGHNNADPIMSGVRFQVETRDGEVTVSSPTGHDMHGPFTLTGSIQQRGTVEMVKQYTSGVAWRWAASMTPFGIVGLWGNPGEGRFILRGRMWLWKRSWAATAAT